MEKTYIFKLKYKKLWSHMRSIYFHINQILRYRVDIYFHLFSYTEAEKRYNKFFRGLEMK